MQHDQEQDQIIPDAPAATSADADVDLETGDAADDLLDWSAPTESLARTAAPAAAARNRANRVVPCTVAVVATVVVIAVLWSLKPGPRPARANPPEPVAPAPQKPVRLFELPPWDDSLEPRQR